MLIGWLIWLVTRLACLFVCLSFSHIFNASKAFRLRIVCVRVCVCHIKSMKAFWCPFLTLTLNKFMVCYHVCFCARLHKTKADANEWTNESNAEYSTMDCATRKKHFCHCLLLFWIIQQRRINMLLSQWYSWIQHFTEDPLCLVQYREVAWALIHTQRISFFRSNVPSEDQPKRFSAIKIKTQVLISLQKWPGALVTLRENSSISN